MAVNYYDVTESVFKWHRRNARLDIDDLPKGIKKHVEAVESGEKDKLTYKQIEEIAERYSVFAHWLIMDKPPDDNELYKVPIQDFRTGVETNIDGRDFSAKAIQLIKSLNAKMSWAKAALEDDEQEPLEFVGLFNLEESNPEEVAVQIVNDFGIEGTEKTKELKAKIEAKGVFVWGEKLSINEVRGFVVVDSIAPYIYYNTGDHPNSQKFTLVHELAHILIGVDGISNNIDNIQPQNTKSVENFCNKVAAIVLMPKSKVEGWEGFGSAKEVKDLAKELGVSNIAMLIRLYTMERINIVLFRSYKETFEREYREYKKKPPKAKKGGGGGNYYTTKQAEDSRGFNTMVYRSYAEHSVSLRDAFALVGVKKNSGWDTLGLKYK